MPRERATVVPFYALRLRHLVEVQARLVVYCGACRKSAEVDVLPVLHKLGPEYGVKEVEKRLTCSKCGQKGWAKVSVEWL
jgi:hypothetical protein